MFKTVEISQTGLLSKFSRMQQILFRLAKSLLHLLMLKGSSIQSIRKNCTTTMDLWLHLDVPKSSNGL